MAIQQLIYHSTATRLLDAAEVDRLVTQARIHNYSQNISGMLFSAHERYLQVLEGETKAVHQLYADITADPTATSSLVSRTVTGSGVSIPARLSCRTASSAR